MTVCGPSVVFEIDVECARGSCQSIGSWPTRTSISKDANNTRPLPDVRSEKTRLQDFETLPLPGSSERETLRLPLPLSASASAATLYHDYHFRALTLG